MRKVLFLFGQLNDEDVEWLIGHGVTREVAAGEILIRQGVRADSVFILLEGHLSVWLERGGEREIARLNAGEIVGEMSFLDSRPPSATVRGIESSTVYAIARDVLAARLAADQGFAARFYRALAIFLATTVRERHRTLGTGVEGNAGVSVDREDDLDEEDDADALDANVLDTISLAGDRFNRLVRRMIGS